MSLKVVDNTQHTVGHRRNPGFPLDLDWVGRIRMNRSALERRAGSIGARRTVKKDYQLAWLLKAITLMDLTTLNSDDTDGRVERLCAKARNPLRRDIIEGLGIGDLRILPGAVCVYHPFVKTSVAALAGTGIPVAAVSTAFPHGLAPVETKLREIDLSVADGAKEIDIVIERGMVLRGDWQALYDQVKANLVTSLTMIRMIRWFAEETGIEIGYKPAGGIAHSKDALNYMALMKEELGVHWLQPHLFRFGASSLLTDIERQLEHGLTGHYAADYRQPMV
jgi:deoxyribose-phosphate aldolase